MGIERVKYWNFRIYLHSLDCVYALQKLLDWRY